MIKNRHTGIALFSSDLRVNYVQKTLANQFSSTLDKKDHDDIERISLGCGRHVEGRSLREREF